MFQFFKGRPLKPPKIKAAPKIRGDPLNPLKARNIYIYIYNNYICYFKSLYI